MNMHNIHKLLIFAAIVSVPSLSWAKNPHDEYYAEDLFTAIAEAKKRPHHYDYSRAKRYNRSTTQSLDIPRLLNQEMEKTSIDTAAATSITAADTPIAKLNKQEQNQLDVNDEAAVIGRTIPVNTTRLMMGNPNVQAANVTTNVIGR